MIRDFVAANEGFGARVSFTDETDLLRETGGGIRHAEPLLADGTEPFLVHNVDILSNLDLAWFRAQHHAGDLATILVSDRETSRYFLFDEDGLLVDWTNIATGELKGHDGRHLAFSGMQILGPEVLSLLQAYPKDSFSLIEFYLSLIHKPYTIHHTPLKAYVPSDYRMMDVGKIDQIEEAERFAKSI